LLIVTKLNNYYEATLKNNEAYIANTKFCKETEGFTNNSSKTYNAYTRLVTNNIPSFNCLGETYRSRIGLMTTDEAAFAGGNFKDNNKEYYLYNSDIKNIWWTSSLAKADNTNFYPFSVNINGKIVSDTSGTLYRNIRPTINIIRKTMVTGDGTKDNPYELILN